MAERVLHISQKHTFGISLRTWRTHGSGLIGLSIRMSILEVMVIKEEVVKSEKGKRCLKVRYYKISAIKKKDKKS